MPNQSWEPNWSLSERRRKKMLEALNKVKALLDQKEPPSFDEMQAALDNLIYQHETAKNAG